MSRAKKIDIEAIRSAASGRWREIISRVGDVPDEILDGKHHPCPKCGGEDRFRLLDKDTGGLYCNQCFSTKNGDGFAAIGWLLDCSFIEAARKVAEHVGIDVDQKKTGPAKDLEFRSWSSALAAHYLKRKSGITEAALLAAGAKLASYKSMTVIAFPIVGQDLDATRPSGWAIVNCIGDTIPKWDKTGKVVGEMKVKLTYGSKPGLIGLHAVERIRSGEPIKVIWKTEGVSDMLALQSVIPEGKRDTHLVVSNSNGTNEKPRWQAEVLAKSHVVVVHDCDEPGQAGAAKWAGAIAARQDGDLETRVVQLPYEVTATKGKDLRDWIAEGRYDYDDLLAMAKKAQPVEASAIPDDEPHIELPAAISNGEEVITETPGGDDQTKVVPVALGDLEITVAETTHDWPKRVGRSLFVMRGDQVNWFEKSPALFGWLQIFGRVDWFEKTGFVKKTEFFEELRSTVEQFDSIERLPHEPPLPKHYYVTRKSVESDGSFLTKLVGFFRPETTIDSDLIKALFATLFWGGPPGSRPAWVLTSDAGRGVGKSKLAQAASHLVGGHVDVSNNEDVETLKSRLLSAEGLDKRVALIDNAKSHRLSWAELEALVTATTISGKRLYVGEASRPNSLNWVVTLNAPSLSTDLAQRSVIIKLAAGKNRPTWWEELIGFIDQDREAIIADCLGFLRSPSTQQLGEYSRWAAWEEAVLCRLPKPAESQKLIIERQASCDADQDESDLIEDYFRSRLHGLGYDHERHSVRIPVTTVAQWYNLATGDKQKTQGVTKRLKQYADEKQMHCLQPDPSRRYGRCFIWVGEHCDITERTQNDLGHRVKEAKQRGDDEDA